MNETYSGTCAALGVGGVGQHGMFGNGLCYII